VNKSFIMLAAVTLSIVTIANPQSLSKTQSKAEQRQIPAASPKSGDKALLMLSFDELHWIELPENKRMQFAVITGDHTKGAYSQMRKVVAGTDNGLHTHSIEITDVIISGLWYAGSDIASARNFGPGSVVVIPANSAHVSGCRPGSDCVFYHEGKGRFDFKPVTTQAPNKKPGT
jgi:quercetin dioxygenase-like cupin family protein